MKLKITVGVICHNEEKQILDCLQSLNENQQDFHELIIVDNNSTDATLTLVKQALIEMQICTQVVARSKNNIAEARNDILQRANGELIYFIDSDCRLKKEDRKSVV